VLEAILATVPLEYQELLGSKDSAKEAWDAFKAMRVGSDRAKKAKAQQLRLEYDDLAFNDGDVVEDFALGYSPSLASWLRTASSWTTKR